MNTAIKTYYSEENTLPTSRRMTEVIIPQGQNSSHIIFPLVASLSKQASNDSNIATKENQRWITWITDRKPSSEQLSSFGADIESLRVIHTKKYNDSRWIIWEALNTGNSHTVIADLESITANDIEQMESAAANGNCMGILTRSITSQ